MSGIYVHIPFCSSRCIYCGFYSTSLLGLRSLYVTALCKEMELRKDYIRGSFSTVYLGGGTPSQLESDDLDRLFSCLYKVYRISPDAEVTIECNPDDITPAFAEVIKNSPVNRVSMGVQTFSDDRLRFLHRRHSAEEITRAVSTLRKAGIKNISLDLMFGFPGEKLSEWHSDIQNVLSLNVEHISAYSLMFEEGTALKRMLDSGMIKEIDDETSLAMYNDLIDTLTSNDYEHYEISNFARKGFRSKHNSCYWNQTPYIGIGAAAHSFDIVSRQWNVSDVRLYIEGVNNGILPMERETLDKDTRFNDIITTALRTSDGINIESIRQILGVKYSEELLKNARQQIYRGCLEITSEGCIRLTRKGIFISDTIMSDLMII